MCLAELCRIFEGHIWGRLFLVFESFYHGEVLLEGAWGEVGLMIDDSSWGTVF